MMIEAFEVLMRGLANRTLDFAGEFYNFKNVPIEVEPLQKPHPPLWYGAGTPQSVERPASTGMSIVTNVPAAVARTLIEHYWKHHKGPAARARRPASPAIWSSRIPTRRRSRSRGAAIAAGSRAS